VDAEEEQHRDIYAHFGLAAYWVQCFEMTLINILLYDARLRGAAPTPEDIKVMEETLQNSKTLGGLIKHPQTQALLPDDVKQIASAALAKRNYLIHHFFREHPWEYVTAEGRQRMITELREIQAIVCLADRKADEVCRALAKLTGVTSELIQAEVEQLREKARRAGGCQGVKLENDASSSAL
jgi:hypothetical protein